MAEKQKQSLLPVYLVVGEDALKRQTVMTRLRARLEEMGNIDFNYDQFDAERVGSYDVVNACNMLPFDSEKRLVEVRRIEKIDKKTSEELVDYLKSPNESTVLALVGEKLAKTTRLYKAVAAFGKTAVIDCAPLKRFELVKAIRSMAVGHGFAMTQSACEKLVALVGTDTVRIDVELRKLALAHRGNDPVTDHEVESLVARTVEVKPWELADALSARDLKKCMMLLPLLESASPYTLMSICTTRVRELICAKSLSRRGEAANLATELSVPPWRVKNHVMWANRFTDEELRNALMQARDCEKAMKSGADPHEALVSWLAETCA